MKARETDLCSPDEATALFCREADGFRFHYRCRSCAHVERSSSTCSLGYPNGYLLGPRRVIQPDGNLTFCKYFELGETTEDLGRPVP